MKVSTVSTTLALALVAQLYAAPTEVVTENSLTERQTDQINDVIVSLNHFSSKRALISDPVELQAREYAIVTQILAAINNTNLAPMIIQGLIDNKSLQPIVTDAVIAIIKSGLISLDTLFTALNESGLAASVIQSLISDCTLYQDIFKLALQEISNLTGLIAQKLAGNSKRELLEIEEWVPTPAKRYDPNGVVNNLLESLANSGLASSVVRALIVDPQFLRYGASLVVELFNQNLINFGNLISALIDSGLVTSLFKEFFTLDTLKTVAVNALAAAFGDCGGSTISGTPTGLTTQKTSTTSLPSFTATGTSIITASVTPTGTSNCKKRRRRRSYNY